MKNKYIYGFFYGMQPAVLDTLFITSFMYVLFRLRHRYFFLVRYHYHYLNYVKIKIVNFSLFSKKIFTIVDNIEPLLKSLFFHYFFAIFPLFSKKHEIFLKIPSDWNRTRLFSVKCSITL